MPVGVWLGCGKEVCQEEMMGIIRPLSLFVFIRDLKYMEITKALSALQNDEPIVIRDKTFKPRKVEAVSLETGEKVYWITSRDSVWLSLDPEGEEIILFEDIDEELEPEDDIVVHGGEDYEFSYEGVATMSQEEGGKVVSFKEYASADGEIIRIMEEESTGEKSGAFGVKLTEEDLQMA